MLRDEALLAERKQIFDILFFRTEVTQSGPFPSQISLDESRRIL